MDIRPLTENLAVTGQITPEDVTAIKAQGFAALICNRPDDEEPGQPAYDAIAAAAAGAGLPIRFIPVAGGLFPPTAVAEFRTALDDLPGPVLAFCRSGARSTMMWQLASQG